ncbi:MAG: hypothetical protein Q8904_13995 [Bacteroidota bacterium]|nr:hypothetical protein [Bacteroidota bacterium]
MKVRQWNCATKSLGCDWMGGPRRRMEINATVVINAPADQAWKGWIMTD